MWQHLTEGAFLFFTLTNFFALLGGTFFGLIMGAIPGLTATLAVALALPFTFYLQPITALVLLVGIYKGGVYAGSIPAILIRTPGTPSAACTVLDGYPLAQQGKAGQALYMALYASCIGDALANLTLIFFTGYIAQFALKFGPPEFFTLICFSLTIIAGVSGDSLSKGLISAGLGLLFTTVGMDLVYGSNRFVFDQVELMSGVSFIPVLIGLFALPELFNAITAKTSHSTTAQYSDRLSFADLKRCFRTILRGTVIGVILGAIPGIGGTPAAFMSYSEARRASKHPETFGKGELEGVAAAESANNAAAPAAMIPLLSLGIPGDVVTGVILGAFMFHGLNPGPLLFKENLSLVYALYICVAVSSIVLLLSGKLAIKGFSQITKIPNKLLFPAVLVVCIYGSFAVNGQLFDVWITVIMGLVGYVMSRFDVPAPPFLIAFVLGALFEDNFRRSLVISGGDYSIFLSSPICWVFIVLTLLSLFIIVRRNVRAVRERQTVCVSEEE